MYQRFTDRARKVMQLANQEAQRFNHEYIGTEHILLGLAKEGNGLAANALRNLNIDLRKIRVEVEKIVPAGPDMVIADRLVQTPGAKRVIEYSVEESGNLNHQHVGTEHLLLGLLRESNGVGAQILMSLGLELSRVRDEVLNILTHAQNAKTPQEWAGEGVYRLNENTWMVTSRVTGSPEKMHETMSAFQKRLDGMTIIVIGRPKEPLQDPAAS